MTIESFKGPLNSAGAWGPWTMTVTIITPMLIRANVLALASCGRSVGGSGSIARDLPYLCNISVQRQRIRNAQAEHDDDRSPVSEQPEEVHVWK